MKKISCKDINPETSCTYEASGDTAKQVVGKMMAHLKSDHMNDLKGMNDGEICSMIESKIHG